MLQIMEVTTTPKKAKTVEEHLEIIENMLAGIILERTPNVKELAKIMGVSSDRLTELYPVSKKKEEEAE
jgi:hypothetical protein